MGEAGREEKRERHWETEAEEVVSLSGHQDSSCTWQGALFPDSLGAADCAGLGPPRKAIFFSRELSASIQPRGLKGEPRTNALQMSLLRFATAAPRGAPQAAARSCSDPARVFLSAF